ncbi:hypothetical protein MPH_06088 [Macrophomina phaseolina MS6]|uniref:Uncharacterized protein n=1 Tax=Macrophomina phaseolina (strain MS6) TaxID=1126212 RepID=K2RVG7_MACPH|nr:hypothetical protein MPH_06088 [Macrophomina phaseolina MS6]
MDLYSQCEYFDEISRAANFGLEKNCRYQVEQWSAKQPSQAEAEGRRHCLVDKWETVAIRSADKLAVHWVHQGAEELAAGNLVAGNPVAEGKWANAAILAGIPGSAGILEAGAADTLGSLVGNVEVDMAEVADMPVGDIGLAVVEEAGN